jgi:outer membrane protein OmpA-like peptidoglycan-associated protein
MTPEMTTLAWNNVRRNPGRALVTIAATVAVTATWLGAAGPAWATSHSSHNPAIVGSWAVHLDAAASGARYDNASSPALVGFWGVGKGNSPARRSNPALVGGWGADSPNASASLARRGNPALIGGWTFAHSGEQVVHGVDPSAKIAPEIRGEARSLLITERQAERPDLGMECLQRIYFDSAMALPRLGSGPALDEVGQTLTQSPQMKLEVAGHADGQGSDAFNDILSRARAQAALDYLTEKFPPIRPDRVTVFGYGESQPVASNDTYAGRARNRRVEFKVLHAEVSRR